MNGAAESHQEPRTFRVIWGPQRFYLSVGWKTLIAFALVVFIPMIGLSLLTSSTLRDALERDALNALEGNLRGAWRVYNQRAEQLQTALIQSGATHEVQAAVSARNSAPLSELLMRHAQLMPFVDVWLALDKSRVTIARRNGGGGDQVVLNNLLLRAYSTGEPLISSEVLSNEIFLRENATRYTRLEKQVLTQVVVVPVLENRMVVGALVGIILLNGYDWLPNAIHEYLSVEAALFASVIQEARIVAAARRPDNMWAEGVLAPPELTAAIRDNQSYRGRAVINGIPSYIIADPIFNFDRQPIGSLSVGVRTDRIESLIKQNTMNVYVFIVFGMFLSMMIAWLAYRDTITPIRALVGAMGAFADGRLDVRTEIETKDEFEDLGEGFNRMAEAIRKHEERVTKFNALTKVLITTLNPRELLQKALDKVVELTDTANGVIFLWDEQNGQLAPFVGYGVDVDGIQAVGLSEGVVGQAGQKREPVLLGDIPADLCLTVNFGVAVGLPTQVAAIPLLYKDKLLGVMLMGTLSRYRQDELTFIEYMADQIAIMLENALTHQKVERLSITDGLTGLYNRRHITERLDTEFSRAMRYGSNLSVLILDIDHFKRVNDSFGHQIGDRVLLTVAEVVRNCVRDSDLVGRYGGEEFIVVLPHTSREQAAVVAEKIRQSIASAAIPSLPGQGLTASIGVATYPESGAFTLNELIHRADASLYSAKEGGRNMVVLAH